MEHNELRTQRHSWIPGTPVKLTPIRHLKKDSVLSSKEKPCVEVATGLCNSDKAVTGKEKAEKSLRGIGLIDLNKSIDEWQEVAGPEATALTHSQVTDAGRPPPEDLELSTRIPFTKSFSPTSQESASLTTQDAVVDRDTIGNFTLVVDSQIDGSAKEPGDRNRLLAHSDHPDNLQRGTNSPESCLSQHVQQEDLVFSLQAESQSQQAEDTNLKKARKQKPRRKKHRPRVLVEGKPKKTPQPRTPKPKKTSKPKTPRPKKTPQPKTPRPEKTPQPKTPRPEKTPKPKTPRPEKTPQPKTPRPATQKRKYVKISGTENSVSRDDGRVSKKRKYTRKNSKSKCDVDIEVALLARTCRQALKFDEENKARYETAIVKAIPQCEVQVEQRGIKKTRSKRRRRLNTFFMRNPLIGQVQFCRRRERSQQATRRCDLTVLTSFPICSQLPRLPRKQATIVTACGQLPMLPCEKTAIKEEAAVESKPCLVDLELNSSLQYENCSLIGCQEVSPGETVRSMTRKHPLELENFGLRKKSRTSQKVFQEWGAGSQDFSQEQRLGSQLELFPEQRTTSMEHYFPEQGVGALEFSSSFLTNRVCGREFFSTFPGQRVGAPAFFPESTNNSYEMSWLEVLQGQRGHGTNWLEGMDEPLRQQIKWNMEHTQEQIIGLQQVDPVFHTNSLQLHDGSLTAESRGLLEENIMCSFHHQTSLLEENLINAFKALSIGDGGSQLMQQADGLRSDTVASYQRLNKPEKGRRQDKGKKKLRPNIDLDPETAVIPCQGKDKGKKKLRAIIDLDSESLRMWNLITYTDDGTANKQERAEELEKWWQKERKIFLGRIQSFTARLHLILGDRRFKPWKGSVVDSVIGVYLTQNVSDNLSSSAYMRLAAKFPVKSTSNDIASDRNPVITDSQESVGSKMAVYGSEGNMYIVTEPETDQHSELKNRIDPIGTYLPEIEDMTNDAVASQTCDTSNIQPTDSFQFCHPESSKANATSPSKTCGGESSTTNSKMIARFETTTLLQHSLDKMGEILPCEECQENGYATSTVIDHGNQASTSGRNDIMSDFGCTSLSDFHYPIKPSIFGSNQDNSGTDIPTSRKGPREKDPRLTKPKSSMRNDGTKKTTSKKFGGNQEQRDWDLLRRMYSSEVERSSDNMDSVDWEAVRCADAAEIASIIKERGQHTIIAGRIKDFLNRLVKLHNRIDLEWLRNVPPDLVKEYLLEVEGLGLKSVECVRLLSLQHIAFPVDVNVGRIAVRLGWVPLQPLPGDLHIHLLEEYPVMDTIQKYLWPRLCHLDQRTLYELHYQMITFGKVFCTKRSPNCGVCPLKGECKHFASAFSSARLALPAPSEKGVVTSDFFKKITANPSLFADPIPTIRIEAADLISESGCPTNNCEPIIEIPASPGPQRPASPEPESEDDFDIGDIEDIPTIRLQEKEFKKNVQDFMETKKIMLQDSRALVVMTTEAASLPSRKLRNFTNLRTEHLVYVLPDNHILLKGFERREADDPCPYLLAIWSPGETPDSHGPPKNKCNFDGSQLCHDPTCYNCNRIREESADIVRGTILVNTCRTANRGRFPLNGTYFQVNEVFADDETSKNPITVDRSTIATLPTQIAYFGSSATSIFRALDLPEIQRCFWRGFVCVRGYDRRQRAPRPLSQRLHTSPTEKGKINKSRRQNI